MTELRVVIWIRCSYLVDNANVPTVECCNFDLRGACDTLLIMSVYNRKLLRNVSLFSVLLFIYEAPLWTKVKSPA